MCMETSSWIIQALQVLLDLQKVLEARTDIKMKSASVQLLCFHPSALQINHQRPAA